MTLDEITPAEIVAFWREAGPDRWFKADPDFDRTIRERFEGAHLAAARGDAASWQNSPEGALALLLLTDQFPRNLYRHSAHAYATDPLARAIAAHALGRRFDQAIEMPLRRFFYLPFEHHEDAASQILSVDLVTRLAELTGDNDGVRFAQLHAELITRFGRFPHRNIVLGRESSAEELAYLANGGFSG